MGRPIVRTTGRAAARAEQEPRTYCSRACRARGVRPGDRALEPFVLELLAEHRTGLTPERVVAAATERGDPRFDGSRPPTEQVRRAVRRLAAAGEVATRQSGRSVDAATAAGPLEIRRARRPGA